MRLILCKQKERNMIEEFNTNLILKDLHPNEIWDLNDNRPFSDYKITKEKKIMSNY
jgi:hypothetical protein